MWFRFVASYKLGRIIRELVGGTVSDVLSNSFVVGKDSQCETALLD
jgi:hypothetical protein